MDTYTVKCTHRQIFKTHFFALRAPQDGHFRRTILTVRARGKQKSAGNAIKLLQLYSTLRSTKLQFAHLCKHLNRRKILTAFHPLSSLYAACIFILGMCVCVRYAGGGGVGV